MSEPIVPGIILVTGAAGKTGRAIIRHLAAREARIRALLRRAEQAEPLLRLGAHEVVIGDMRDVAIWSEALRGVRTVYFICPNLAPDEIQMGHLAMRAAVDADVDHFVYHSVLHPQTEAMPHHWRKLRVEEQLFQSDLSFTILQPAAYMQNVLAAWDEIVTQGIYHIPYAAETRLGMVDLEDVAAAAAVVLTEPGHQGATYELAGPQALTQIEVAATLSRLLERPVRAETIPLDVWERKSRAAGLGDYQVTTLRQMFCYYERHGFWGNPRVLGWLLGRPPTTLAKFVERVCR